MKVDEWSIFNNFFGRVYSFGYIINNGSVNRFSEIDPVLKVDDL